MESIARPCPRCNHFDLCIDLTGKLPIEADRSLNAGLQIKRSLYDSEIESRSIPLILTQER